MNIEYDQALVAHRINLLDALGVGPLWLPREAMAAAGLAGAAAAIETEAVSTATSAALPHTEQIAASAAPIAPIASAAPTERTAPVPMASVAPTAAPDLRREENAAKSAPPASGFARSAEVAWHDDGAVAGSTASVGSDRLRASVTVCTTTVGAAVAAAVGGATRASHYFFVTRPTSAEGVEELFDNILRALGLQKDDAASAEFSTTFTSPEELAARLSGAVAADTAAMVVLMDPDLALQLTAGADANYAGSTNAAALQCMESLRGRFHRVIGPGRLPAIATYGPAHLVRNRLDKREVWDDLCLMLTYEADPV